MTTIRPSLEILKECMQTPSCIRNVCILAHVDHGKTTIADSLLSTNRLVSKRMAGFIRYLDDRLDEQERGITMKSSTVSLLNFIANEETQQEEPQLLNIIDTPGHIDFSSEVGAALRVCDGALIVVDLVEGVCVQTREAIKLAFTEKCKMILVLNKIDKLIVELHKNVDEIFLTILHVVENCNAILAEFYQYEYSNSEIDIEDSGILFSPDIGNVIFVSGIDGWGFTTKDIARIFQKTLPNETTDSINKKLWDFDQYVDSKTNSIKNGAIEKGKTNLFIQLFLKTVYHIYETIIIKMQKDKVSQILNKLNIKNVTREMNHNDCKIQLRAIMQAWSPISDIILKQIMRNISPPCTITTEKIHYLLDYNKLCEHDTEKKLDKIVENLKLCSPKNPECCAYVSKMFCVDNKNLSQYKPKIFVPKQRTEKIEKETVETVDKPVEEFSIIALAKVFSGTLKTGDEIYVIGDSKAVTIKQLYIQFGRELMLTDSVTAGNICGIGGLELNILRTATLSSDLNSVKLMENSMQPAIVRNAIEPVNPKDLPILRQALRVLMQSDSCVQVVIQESGEYVLETAGDVHLAKCLEDLKKFAKIEVIVSSPMVSLRETVITAAGHKKVTVETPPIRLTLSVVSLPQSISEEISKNYKLLNAIEELQQISGFEIAAKRLAKLNLKKASQKFFKNDTVNLALSHVKKQIGQIFESFPDLKHPIWSVGRLNDSISLLLNSTENYSRSIFESLDETDGRSCFDHFVVNAFNSCCKAGPICEEPLKDCAFLVKNFEIINSDCLDGSVKTNVNIELLLSLGFREAFEQQQQRLMEPMFTTSIQVNTNILGKVYSVINKRHGRVLDSVGMDEQERSFLVKAEIPVVESTGFANEIRKTTSGQAMPTLKFSHFEVIDGDPFYEFVEDDEDDDDVKVDSAIRAVKLRKALRKRKGLHVEEQVVVHGEKQRTLNKKK